MRPFLAYLLIQLGELFTGSTAPTVQAQQPPTRRAWVAVGLGIVKAREVSYGAWYGTRSGVAILAGTRIPPYTLDFEAHPYVLTPYPGSTSFRAYYLMAGRRFAILSSLYFLPTAGAQYRSRIDASDLLLLAIGFGLGSSLPVGNRTRLEPELTLRVATRTSSLFSEQSGDFEDLTQTVLISLRVSVARRM